MRMVRRLHFLSDGSSRANLIYQLATWDSPPKPNDDGYEEYVQAFDAFLEAHRVILVPLSPSEQKKKDNRPPRDMPVIKDPGFEQGGKLMPFQASGTDLRFIVRFLIVDCSSRV